VAVKKNPAKKPRAKMGRQTKYDPDYHPLAAWTLAIKGMVDKEIAAKLRISTGTLAAWKNAHPDFLSSLKEGKGIANAKVEKGLYKVATGFKYKERKKTVDTYGTPKTEVTTKYVPPNPTACIFWLNKRDPENWPGKQEHEVTGKDGLPIKVTHEYTLVEGVKPPDRK
jgi:hypothetical protein